MNKKVLVFGGSGFLGSYVVEELLKRNYSVKVADLVPSQYFDESLWVHCDILDRENIHQVMEDRYDFVFNFSGFASLDKSIHSPMETIQLNVMGNLNIIDACKDKNIERFIFASSAYAMTDKGSYYGISKLTSEKLIEEYYKNYGLKFTIVRYGSVYSERNFENNYIFNLIKAALTNRHIEHEGDGEEIREYIHAADAAKLSVDIIESIEYVNEYIILTGFEKMKRIDLFRMIKEILREDLQINLIENGKNHHYQLTPYSFHPAVSKKLIANPFIDIGQGILECIKEVHRLLDEEEHKTE